MKNNTYELAILAKKIISDVNKKLDSLHSKHLSRCALDKEAA